MLRCGKAQFAFRVFKRFQSALDDMSRMLEKAHVDTGAIARDFSIPVAGNRFRLSFVGHHINFQRDLFPECEPQIKNATKDAFLTCSPFLNTFLRKKPTLWLTPGFLRAPRSSQSLPSATLSHLATARPYGWPERVMARDGWLTPALARRAASLLAHVVSARVGGDCWAPPPQRHLGRRVVVFASANLDATRAMLQQALHQGMASELLLVTKRPGRIGAAAKRLGMAVVSRPVDPWPLIEHADHVHAPAGSEAALLAAFLGKTVDCLGPGPLAVTCDGPSLAAAVLLLGTRYVDPFTGRPATCETFLDFVSEVRRQRDANATVACCVGISFWKRRRVAAMLGTARSPAFRKTATAAIAAATTRRGAIVVWPSRAPAALAAKAAAAAIPVLRLEDGFVRSVGLGADFQPPLSLVLDRLGIYYDATGPSDLEHLLSTTTFQPDLLLRSAALRRRMVQEGVTKYNLASGRTLVVPPSRRLILVPGQVADDRSVLLGGAGVRPGLDLLRRVRQEAPKAYILYKPHPDVDAGHRPGAVPDADALRFADQIVRDVAMAELLATVHELHTLTSLAGFEALLRGKPVTTYGQPFYAGWGLTTDLNPSARRTRRLALDELVAGSLVLYPRYIDPVTLLPCGPEVVLDRLRAPEMHRASLLVMARRMQGRLLSRSRGLAERWHRIRKDAA